MADEPDKLEYTRLDRALVERAAPLLARCQALNLHIVTAESCTGGLLAGVLTEAPGASKVVEGGFVTYSNRAKHDVLGVAEDMIAVHGAVSAPVARAMAEGALAAAPDAELAVAVTGIAGPSGGSADKPVGLVFFGGARRGGPTVHRECRFGDIGRGEVRRASIVEAIEVLEGLVQVRPTG
jgi:nicotinamide-nucleotide amidase